MDKNSKKHKSKNKNLEDVLDGFGQHIEVLNPRILRHRIKKNLQVAFLQYELAAKQTFKSKNED